MTAAVIPSLLLDQFCFPTHFSEVILGWKRSAKDFPNEILSKLLEQNFYILDFSVL